MEDSFNNQPNPAPQGATEGANEATTPQPGAQQAQRAAEQVQQPAQPAQSAAEAPQQVAPPPPYEQPQAPYGQPQAPQGGAGQPYIGTAPPPPYGAPQTVYVQQPIFVKKSNGAGTTGFVLALLNAIFSFIPVVNAICFILWPLGLIFSLIGVFKSPRGLAIAGLILSLIGIIILLFFVAALGLAASM